MGGGLSRAVGWNGKCLFISTIRHLIVAQVVSVIPEVSNLIICEIMTDNFGLDLIIELMRTFDLRGILRLTGWLWSANEL